MSTANGYLLILLRDFEELSSAQAAKLKRIASFIVSVYVPMFFRIHSNPRAPEGPNNMLFLRDVVLDYKHIDNELVEVIRKIFLKHFHAWMNPTNVALNIHSKIPAYKIDHLNPFTSDVNLRQRTIFWPPTSNVTT